MKQARPATGHLADACDASRDREGAGGAGARARLWRRTARFHSRLVGLRRTARGHSRLAGPGFGRIGSGSRFFFPRSRRIGPIRRRIGPGLRLFGSESCFPGPGFIRLVAAGPDLDPSQEAEVADPAAGEQFGQRCEVARAAVLVGGDPDRLGLQFRLELFDAIDEVGPGRALPVDEEAAALVQGDGDRPPRRGGARGQRRQANVEHTGVNHQNQREDEERQQQEDDVQQGGHLHPRRRAGPAHPHHGPLPIAAPGSWIVVPCSSADPAVRDSRT